MVYFFAYASSKNTEIKLLAINDILMFHVMLPLTKLEHSALLISTKILATTKN